MRPSRARVAFPKSRGPFTVNFASALFAVQTGGFGVPKHRLKPANLGPFIEKEAVPVVRYPR